MRRLAFALLAVTATIAIPSTVAAGEPATCSFSSATHTVTITVAPGTDPPISRDDAGHINVNGVWCGGATVTNTDLIEATGGDGLQGVNIDLGHGGFKPGRTNEAGKSDEIEFRINLGGGIGDNVHIIG